MITNLTLQSDNLRDQALSVMMGGVLELKKEDMLAYNANCWLIFLISRTVLHMRMVRWQNYSYWNAKTFVPKRR